MQVSEESAWLKSRTRSRPGGPVESPVINAGSLFRRHKGMNDVEGAAAERTSQIANDGREKA